MADDQNFSPPDERRSFKRRSYMQTGEREEETDRVGQSRYVQIGIRFEFNWDNFGPEIWQVFGIGKGIELNWVFPERNTPGGGTVSIDFFRALKGVESIWGQR